MTYRRDWGQGRCRAGQAVEHPPLKSAQVCYAEVVAAAVSPPWEEMPHCVCEFSTGPEAVGFKYLLSQEVSFFRCLFKESCHR